MKRYRVAPGETVQLDAHDPADKSAFGGNKEAAKKAVVDLNARLEELQELLYAQGRHKLLVVLQAMDTGGKDSTIRSVFQGVNPQGVKVMSFKKPTPIELSHDFLWRVHQHTPAMGEIAIFNRSHYEDVLVARVHESISKEQCRKRCKHIVDFEEMLCDEGVTICKFFLHISKDEQKKRLQERLDTPHKHWKFSAADLKERTLWSRYMKAYEAALEHTSTGRAPWYVVPANSKWYRNLVVSTILVETLESLQMQYPAAEPGLDQIVID